MAVAEDRQLEELLEYLRDQRGFDFTGYKRSTLQRRIAKRMHAVGAPDYEAYRDRLEVDQEEFQELFDTILINVTSFFRDPDAWEHLAREVVPRILAAKSPHEPIRVWCAGCASGEEPYTVAMVLAEALGDEAFAERVKVYATDIDDDALATARGASYTGKQLENVPDELLGRYFTAVDSRRCVRRDLRRAVIFGRNDLVGDAPISRVDLLLCRNTLMYFNVEAQARILRRFGFALNPDGLLFLGKSEMLIAHTSLFAPTELKHRVFTRVATRVREELPSHLPAHVGLPGVDGRADGDGGSLRDHAFDAASLAQLVVGRDGILQLANARARELVGLAPDDVGRPFKDLQVSYRPVELRSRLEELWQHGRATTLEAVELVTAAGETRVVDVAITPLGGDERVVGASLAFDDVTDAHRLKGELAQSHRELETAYEELQSTVEELETTNEELQSTNEELETTNEELHSTNEELKTMNEELHSTNDQLEATNDELRERTLQLHHVNAFLETILTSVGMAVVVLDSRLRVQLWNAQAIDLWGARADEVEGEHFLGLDLGLPVQQLKAAVRACLDGASAREEVVVDATTRRGTPTRCTVTAMPMRQPDGEITGVTLLMRAQSPGTAG